MAVGLSKSSGPQSSHKARQAAGKSDAISSLVSDLDGNVGKFVSPFISRWTSASVARRRMRHEAFV
jgi:hypothetical protein